MPNSTDWENKMIQHSMVVEVISDLEATTSKLSKLKIMRDNKDLPGLKEFFLAALDPFATYYIKKIPSYVCDEITSISLTTAIGLLEDHKSRKVTGDAAIKNLKDILTRMHPLDADLIERIIQKDPACGVQTSVNDVWPKLIKEFPMLLCSAYDKKLVSKLKWQNGVIVQEKSDGARCNIIIDENGGVEVFSRQGRPIDVKGNFDYLGCKFKSVVIDGELLINNPDGTLMDRKSGNGIVNKAIKGTISDEQANLLFLNAWDVIPLEDFKNEICNIPYVDRLESLLHMVDGDKVRLIPSETVYSIEDAMKIYNRYYEVLKKEGAILKDQDAIWNSKRSKQQVKLKAELDCDLVIVGYQGGEGALEGLMGALLCESSDGKVKVNVGGGFSLKQRAQIASNFKGKSVEYITTKDGIETSNVITPNGEQVIGSIIAVIYNEKISCDGEYSLFLPRAADGNFRVDKSIADSFEEIK